MGLRFALPKTLSKVKADLQRATCAEPAHNLEHRRGFWPPWFQKMPRRQ